MDLNSYLNALSVNTKSITDKLRNLTTAQLNSRIGEGWTIIQVAEHVLLTEKTIRNFLLKPSAQQHDSGTIIGAEKLRRLMVDLRNRKVRTSASFEPVANWPTFASFEIAFLATRNQLFKDLSEGTIKITNDVYKHPVLGEMTVEDWLYFILHHAERHVRQMDDILEKN